MAHLARACLVVVAIITATFLPFFAGTRRATAQRLVAHVSHQLLQLGSELDGIEIIGAAARQQHQIQRQQCMLLQAKLFAHDALDQVAGDGTAYRFLANDKTQPGLGAVIKTCEQ